MPFCVMKVSYLLLAVSLFFLGFLSLSVRAETSTETFLNTIVTDLPSSKVACRGLGVMQSLILRTPIFESKGNSFFIDKKNKEIAVFERAEIINVNDNNKKITADLYLRVPNVQREDLVNLLLLKKLVATRNVQAVFVVKVITGEKKDVYVFTGKDESGAPTNSTIVTRLKKLGNVTFEGKKFVTVYGTTKIRFPEPPKKVATDGTLVNVFGRARSGIVCEFKNTPVHDFDLTDLKEAFDEQLADDILKEASGTNLDGEDTLDEGEI